eukprot:jgi/Undpi1/1092/HiC_scaffold_10.g04555.m1
MPPPSPTAVTKGNGGGGGGGGGGGVSSGLDGDKTGGVAGKVGGKGGGAGTIKIPGRRGPPTKFLTTLHDMLIAGNPQIWWERETGSVVIENPPLFETETMPLHFPDVKIATFIRQLTFYGFKKDVSCIKSLLTKKGYEQRRLENAIRNTATGASPSPRVSGGSVPAAENGRANGSCSEGANRGKEGMAGGNGKEAGVRNEVAGGAGGGEKSPAGCKKAKRIRSKGLKEEVAERTELEVATEAAVVRAREVGMEARMELRQSMSRSQLGRWQLEQTAKLMIQVMQLNAKLVKGLKECRARGGPPRIRRCRFNSPAVANMRMERARLKRRVRQLEDELEDRGLQLPS